VKTYDGTEGLQYAQRWHRLGGHLITTCKNGEGVLFAGPSLTRGSDYQACRGLAAARWQSEASCQATEPQLPARELWRST